MKRRDFLKNAGCFVATAGVGGIAGCDDEDWPKYPDAGPGDGGPDAGTDDRSFSFPQGVASGDPRPSSVMLWTRVQPMGGDGDVRLRLEVSELETFELPVVNEVLEVGAESDFTARVLVENLDPNTVYYYRFRAGSDRSRVGRTWTAPEADADIPIRFAWVSCQDYSAGFYGAYRRMLNDDEDAPASERLRFVLHVGDFIYETRGEGFQVALDENLEPVMLVDRSGNPRMVSAFPSGGGTLESGGQYARTVDDYRHLYKTFLQDADLQAARAHWPFVCVWDDHEFSDDSWQTQANYTREDGSDEPSQKRKVAANQAWFEYVPAILSEAEDADVEPAAKNFEAADVDDVAYTEQVDVDEPNNTSALASLTIYRRLRFGQHVDLVLTDNRSYRSDHCVAEEATAGNPLVFHPRAGLALSAVNAFDAGRDADGGNPPSSLAGYENTRTASPPGTVLGAEQKQWWKDVLSASDASFKVWGNSIPLLRFVLDTTEVGLFSGTGDLVLSTDAWDGFPTERRELMAFLRDNGIRNVVSLSGDHHAHLAGLVVDDPDASSPVPVMADFATAGISSSSQWSSVAGAIETAVSPDLLPVVEPVLKLIVFDATMLGGPKAVVNFNTLLRYGAVAARIAHETNDLAMVEAARDANVNPHLRYVDCAANGYGLAEFRGDGAELTLVTVARPLTDAGEAGLSVRGTARFSLPLVEGDAELTLDEPVLDGEKPYPLE